MLVFLLLVSSIKPATVPLLRGLVVAVAHTTCTNRRLNTLLDRASVGLEISTADRLKIERWTTEVMARFL